MSATLAMDPAPIAVAAKRQVGFSALFIGVIALTCLAISLLARSDAVERFSASLQIGQWQRDSAANAGNGGRYAYHPLARDAGDYLLLRDLPSADFSRGGVIYLGSSTMLHALTPWELPPAQRRSIHNFAVESANMLEQHHWARYLVEHEHIDRAGPGKTMVVLGLSHLDVRDKLPGTPDSQFVEKLFDRHGLYDYSRAIGLAPKPMSAVERVIVREKMRDRGLLQQLGTDIATEVVSRWGVRPAPLLTAAEADRIALVGQQNAMGGDAGWRDALAHQMSQLGRTVDLLQAHGIVVRAVLLPMKTYNDGQPFAKAFSDAARALLAAKGVTLTDDSRAAPDTEFADAAHLNYTGQHRQSERMLVPALAHLRQIGVIER